MPSTRQAVLLGVWSCLSILLLVAIPPWQPAGFEASLDASWQAVFHHVPFTDWQFGTDVLLHYGPYGFLHPAYFDPLTYSWVLGRYVLFAGLLAGGFFLAARGGRDVGTVEKGLVFLLVPFYVRYPDAVVLSLAVTYLFVRTQEPKEGLRAWEVPFLFALALAFHAKLNHSLAVLVVVLLANAVHVVRFGRLNTGLPLFLAFTAAGWWAAGQGFATMPAFVRGSWEIARGYGDVLGLQGSLLELGIVVAGCVTVLVLLARVRFVAEPAARWLELAGVALVLLLAFKSAYVRHSTRLYPTEVLLVVGALALARAWRQAAPQRSLVAGVAAAGVALATHLAAVAANDSIPFVHYHAAEPAKWRTTLAAMNRGRYRPPFRELSERHAKAVERVREAYPLEVAGRMDVFGHLQAVALANDLDYAPRPVFQSYHAYTPYLSRLNGEYYRGPDAPPTVVAQIAPIFGFAPSMLDAEAFLELLRSYRFAGRSADLIVLEHVGSKPPRRETVLEVEVAPGQDVAVEGATEAWLWATIDVRPGFAGRLVGSLLKLPPIWLETRTATGLEFRHRLPVQAARGGFLLSPHVLGWKDFLIAQGVRRGQVPPTHAVVSLRIAVDEADAWAFDGATVRLEALVRDGRRTRG